MTKTPREKAIEKVAEVMRGIDVCGATNTDTGKSIFCDDDYLADKPNGYGEFLKCKNCECKQKAQAVIDLLGLEFVDNESEVEKGDVWRWNTAFGEVITKYVDKDNLDRMQQLHNTKYNKYYINPIVIQRNNKPVINVDGVGNE